MDRVGHYSYKVNYIPGKENEFADALFQNPGISVEMPDLPGGICFQGQVRRVETNNQNNIWISVDLFKITMDGKKNEEYSNLVQVILDGPKLKDLPGDNIAQQFIHYKEKGEKNIYK